MTFDIPPSISPEDRRYAEQVQQLMVKLAELAELVNAGSHTQACVLDALFNLYMTCAYQYGRAEQCAHVMVHRGSEVLIKAELARAAQVGAVPSGPVH
jgi:hypothetical protein